MWLLDDEERIAGVRATVEAGGASNTKSLVTEIWPLAKVHPARKVTLPVIK